MAVTGGSGHGFKFGSMIGRLVMDRMDGTPGSWLDSFSWDHLVAASARA